MLQGVPRSLRLVDRVSRLNAARGRTGVHFGLGLPMVQRITRLLGHEIEIRTERGGEFIFLFRFAAEGASS